MMTLCCKGLGDALHSTDDSHGSWVRRQTTLALANVGSAAELGSEGNGAFTTSLAGSDSRGEVVGGSHLLGERNKGVHHSAVTLASGSRALEGLESSESDLAPWEVVNGGVGGSIASLSSETGKEDGEDGTEGATHAVVNDVGQRAEHLDSIAIGTKTGVKGLEDSLGTKGHGFTSVTITADGVPLGQVRLRVERSLGTRAEEGLEGLGVDLQLGRGLVAVVVLLNVLGRSIDELLLEGAVLDVRVSLPDTAVGEREGAVLGVNEVDDVAGGQASVLGDLRDVEEGDRDTRHVHRGDESAFDGADGVDVPVLLELGNRLVGGGVHLERRHAAHVVAEEDNLVVLVELDKGAVLVIRVAEQVEELSVKLLGSRLGREHKATRLVVETEANLDSVLRNLGEVGAAWHVGVVQGSSARNHGRVDLATEVEGVLVRHALVGSSSEDLADKHSAGKSAAADQTGTFATDRDIVGHGENVNVLNAVGASLLGSKAKVEVVTGVVLWEIRR